MPNYLVTMAYNMDQNGWTENFYRTADTAVAATDFGGPTQDARLLSFRNNQVTLYAVRARRIGGQRESYIRYPQIEAAGGSGRAPAAPAAQPPRDVDSTAVYVRWESGAIVGVGGVPGKSRAMMIRGVPDSWLEYDNSGMPIIGGEVLAGFRRFLAFVKQKGFANQIRVPDDSQPRMRVKNIVPDPNSPGRVIVSVDDTVAGLANGDRVSFGLVPTRDLPFLVGSYPIDNLAAHASFTIAYRLLQAGYTPSRMYARKVAYQYPVITDGEIVDFRSHKTGRPTVRLVGRRSTTRVSH